MRPGAIDGLHLTDDSFFKIKPTLAPAKNLGDRGFPFQGTEDRVPDRAMSEVNLAVAAARFESKPAAALTEAAHLQDLSCRELVEITDQGMTRINPFRRRAALGQGTNKILQLRAQIPWTGIARDSGDLLLLRGSRGFRVSRLRSETNDSQRWEMLASVGGLIQRNRGLAFDDKPVEILRQQHRHGFGHRAHDAGLDVIDLVENGKSAVLKDRISI